MSILVKFLPALKKIAPYLIVLILGVLLTRACAPAPKPEVITKVVENTVTVQVPVEKITTKIVKEYITDTANAERLLKENNALHLRVTELSETLAKYTSQGTGPVVVTPPVQPGDPTAFTFKDWRLDFTSDGTTANYTLTQKFEVLSTTGRDKDGAPVHLVKLFEIAPSGARLPITDTKTTTIVTDGTRDHWMLGIDLQAGIGVTWNTSGTNQQGGVVGVQWLKRGRTSAAEDSYVSLLTPVAFASESGIEAGILPVSVNLGRAKYTPFKDIWLSPLATPNRLGAVLTATF